MKKLVLLFAFLACWSFSVRATDITVQALTVNNIQTAGLGTNRTGTATVSNGSTSVTCSACLPTSLVGLSGYQIVLGAYTHYVSATASTSAFTLSSAYAGASGSVSFTLYPTVLFRLYASMDFLPLGASSIIQQGPPGGGNFYQQYAVSVYGNAVYLPSLTLAATTDCPIQLHRNARYSAWFHRMDGSRIQGYGGFDAFAVPATPTSTTWAELLIYNTPVVASRPDNSTYTRSQVDALVAANSSVSGTFRTLLMAGSGGAAAVNSPVTADASNNIAMPANLSVGGAQTVGGNITGGAKVIGGLQDNGLGGQFYNTLFYATGDGSTDDRAALNTLANTTMAAQGGGTLLFGSTGASGSIYRIASDVTFPVNVRPHVVPGAMIRVESGVKVNFLNGDFVAGKKQKIFDLRGTTVGTAVMSATKATITSCTNASPIVCTATGHGLTTGNKVIITGARGNTAANNLPDAATLETAPRYWTVTVVDANTFSLDGSTGNGAWDSVSTAYAWKGFVLSSSSANFQTTDTWSPVLVAGAGVSGTNLAANIVYRISATEVILSTPASTTVNNANLTYRYGRVTFGGVDCSNGCAANNTDHPSNGAIIPVLKPGWWGAKGDFNGALAGSTDDTLALLQMIAVTPAYSTVEFDGNMRIMVTGEILFNDRIGVKWLGVPSVNSATSGSIPSIQYLGPDGLRLLNLSSLINCTFENLYFSGNGLSAGASTTAGADNTVWLNKSMSAQGTLNSFSSDNTFQNCHIWNRNLRTNYTTIWIGDVTGDNDEYHKFINCTLGGGSEDNPTSANMYGRVVYLAHSNVKQIIFRDGQLHFAKYGIWNAGGSFIFDSVDVGYIYTAFYLQSWSDKLVIRGIDSEGIAQLLNVPVGAGTNGPIEVSGGRFDRSNTAAYSGIVGTAARPWIDLHGQVRLNISDNFLGGWAHSTDFTWYSTNRYLIQSDGSASVVWSNNLVNDYDENQLALNLQTAHTVDFWSRDRGKLIYSGDSVNSSAFNAITTTGLPRELVANLHLAGEADKPGSANTVVFDNGKWQIGGLADPILPTLNKVGTHTGGTTSYTFLVIGVDGSGRRTMPSGVRTIANVANTLTGSNYVQADWAAIPGVSTYILVEKSGATYRTVATGIATNTYNVTSNPAGPFTYTLPTFNETSQHTIWGSITQSQFGSGFVNAFAAPTTFSGGLTLTDTSDTTKKLTFGLSNIATGTTRTATWPNSNTTIPVISQILTFAGPTAARTVTLPDASFAVAGTDVANTFSANQAITGTLTLGSGGTAISKHLSATATLDFDLSAAASQDLAITVTGAALGDSVAIGVPHGSVTADTLFFGWVSAADTVTIRAMRIAGTPNPASGTFRADVWRH